MDPASPPDQPNPFGPPAAGPAVAPKTSGLAIASLVLGLLSLIFSILTAIPAIICGILALRSINRSSGAVEGSGLAIAGIVTGGLGTVLLGGCVALLLPAVQAAREAARASMSMNNMKQLQLAALNYESSYGEFPSAAICDDEGNPLLSWRVRILPFLETGVQTEDFHLDEPWDSEHNLAVAEQMPAVFMPPNQDLPPGETNYLLAAGAGTAFEDVERGPKMRFITDGTSNTIMLVEADADHAVPWTKPQDLDFDPRQPLRGLGNYRPGTWTAGFFDASVKRIPNDTMPQQVTTMMTHDAGD